MRKPIFRGWWQVVADTLAQAVGSASIIMCYSVIAVPMAKEFTASYGVLMLGATMRSLISGLVNPIAGAAMERYSLRHVMLVGAFMTSAGFLAISYSTSIVHLILVYAVPFAIAVSTTALLAYSVHLPRWFVKRRATAMGITAMGFAMGAMILPPLLQFLVDAYGWRDALRMFSGIMFLALVPALVWLVVDRPSDVGLYPDGESAPPPSTAQAGEAKQIATGAVLRDVNFWLITIFITLLVAGSGGYISNMVPFAISREFTAAQGAYTLSCFAIGSFASLILFAAIGDRTHPRVLMAACLFAFTLSSFCYLNAHTYPVLLLGGVLHGLAMGGMQPLWGFVTARIFGPGNVAKVYSLTAILMTPTALAAHPAMGRLFDLTGAYDYAFMVMMGACLAGSFLMLRLRIPAVPAAAPQPAH